MCRIPERVSRAFVAWKRHNKSKFLTTATLPLVITLFNIWSFDSILKGVDAKWWCLVLLTLHEKNRNYLFMLKRLEKRNWRYKKQSAISSHLYLHTDRDDLYVKWKGEWKKNKNKKFKLKVWQFSSLCGGLACTVGQVQGYNLLTHIWRYYNS